MLNYNFQLIYIGFYLQHTSSKADEATPVVPPPTDQPIHKSHFKVSIGNKNMLLGTDEIALLVSQNKITQALTLDGKRFITTYSLKQAYEMIDPAGFFQANRQIIINRILVKGYRRLPNRKLELILENPDLFPDPIFISKEKTPHFLDWLSA